MDPGIAVSKSGNSILHCKLSILFFTLFATDADITPLLELFEKGTKVLKVKGFSKEHQKLGCLVCLLEGCDFAWYSSNMLQLNKELKNHREIHAKDKKEYFNVRLVYREETDIGRKKEKFQTGTSFP